MKSELKDRTLWWDGVVGVHPSHLQEMIISGIDTKHLVVSELTDEVQQFNKLASNKISVGHEPNLDTLDRTWSIPEPYRSMDIDQYVLDVLIPRVTPDASLEERYNRVALELEFFANHGFYDLLRTLIYVTDKFKESHSVWGVGRGSSCASYLLYLIGIHSVDPIKYKIPLDEFFK